MTRINLQKLNLLALASFLPFSALAQDGAVPAEKLAAVFSVKNKSRLCNSDNRVRSAVLLGELGKVYQINLFALPDVAELRDSLGDADQTSATTSVLHSYNDPVARRAAYWITKSSAISPVEAAQLGIGPEHELLTDLNLELIRFAYNLKAQEGIYQLPSGVSFGDQAVLADRKKIIALMLDPPIRPGAEPTAAIACSTGSGDRQSGVVISEQARAKNSLGWTIAVRGGIDDLAIPRNGRDEVFKKAADAKIAYTMNGVKKEEAIAANITLGVGWVLDNYDALMGFARYSESSTETKAAGDQDDAKDVRALSAGLMYRHSISIGNLSAQSGITTYKTWDRAQDSQLIRVRAFAEDVSLVYADGPIICGRQSHWGGLYYSCRTSFFAEAGRVLDAGRSTDFADPKDDDYIGAGAEIGLSFWLPGVKPASQLMLTAQYKKMWVLDGDLENPSRFTIELSYKIPDSDISLGLSRSYGENFDSFQKEELNLLSVGYKY